MKKIQAHALWTRKATTSACRHPPARRVLIEHWQWATPVYQEYPCECGEQAGTVAFRTESNRLDFGYTIGYPEDGWPTAWERPEITDTEFEVLEEEQICDCFPDGPHDFDWHQPETGATEIVESVIRERCEACGEEWDA